MMAADCVIRGRENRDLYNGAVVEGSELVHLGLSPTGQTVCGKTWSNFMSTYSDVEITCPDCRRIIREKLGAKEQTP